MPFRGWLVTLAGGLRLPWGLRARPVLRPRRAPEAPAPGAVRVPEVRRTRRVVRVKLCGGVGVAGLLVVLCGGVGVLGGCGGGESEPSAAPSVSETPSPPPSGPPTSKEPPLPARTQSEYGAVSFLRFYIGELNRAARAPGTVDFAPISDPGCLSCKAFNETQQEYLQKKKYYKADILGTGPLEVLPESTEDRVVIGFMLISQPTAYYIKGKDGEPAGTLTREEGQRAAQVFWTGDRWVLWGMADRADYDKGLKEKKS